MKRRLIAFIICLMVMLGFAMPVFADSGATYVENITTITSDGNCQVTLRVNIHIDEPVDDLTFPLPLGAKDIMMNGSSAHASKMDGALHVDISDMIGDHGGDVSLKFDFRLEKVVRFEEDKYLLELPLLSGFEYPVERMEFTITLPDDIKGRPYFTGGYRPSTVESVMTIVVKGDMITGSVNQALDDRETLTMTMEVDEKMFPGKLVIFRDGNPEALPMGICAAAALLYWLLLMRCLPLIRQRRTLPLEGITAGELGCHLTAAGADLTMMVFTWAELGYLRIYPDKRGRVYLQKYMDMDNERTAFENRCFYSLFSRGDVVDATSGPYARLCLKVAGNISGVKEMYLRHAGNAFLFRALCCGICLFSGICYGNNFTTNPTLRVVLSIGLSLLGVVSAWIIQDGMYRLHIRGKLPIYLSTLATVLWITLGILSGSWLIGLLATLAQLLAGLAAAYGGRRSDLGRSQAGLILGFRHYLGTIPQEELERTVENDPDFFFRMLPYAIAMGVDTRFAKLFGEQKMPHCTYMVTREDRKRTAAEWALLLRKTADRMDALQRKMQLEKLLMIGSHRR